MYNSVIIVSSTELALRRNTMSRSTDMKPQRQAHRTNSKRYWKQKAEQFARTGVFSEENLTRMRRGLAPRRLAKLAHKETGEVIEFHAPIELHHVFGNKAEIPQEEQTLVEVYPWQHAQVDEDRRFKWNFVQWVGFQ